MRRLPHVSFVNLYGPTEATIASSYYRVPRCPETKRLKSRSVSLVKGNTSWCWMSVYGL